VSDKNKIIVTVSVNCCEEMNQFEFCCVAVHYVHDDAKTAHVGHYANANCMLDFQVATRVKKKNLG